MEGKCEELTIQLGGHIFSIQEKGSNPTIAFPFL